MKTKCVLPIRFSKALPKALTGCRTRALQRVRAAAELSCHAPAEKTIPDA